MNYTPKHMIFNTFVTPIYDFNLNFMKNALQFFFIIIPIIMVGQTKCDDANSYLVSAYSHVKNAYESNNISHLKYYANRSLESFKLSRVNLKDCNCDEVLELNQKGIDILAKVEATTTFEDGRFFVNRARKIGKETVIALDKCSFSTASEIVKNLSDPDHETLSVLKQEQMKLNEQQEALKRQEQEIKMKLARQKEKELLLKKQQLISSYKLVISSNIETYNQTLTLCSCDHTKLITPKLTEDISTKTIDAIKSYYTNNLKELASNYLSELNMCN
ncbi:hypothetical protein [Algibacter mikhailovii]|uniref:Uncharacterized protein n=1 Tax=Algibacter mikhailovii TaxID=425498 RepID=A0A918V7L0_9FLAO|nr:hypothetical protein [Algibacter mikhailovii]GGZ76914.1 hypothetical protein GCM10007028_12670 [Algibacter mikhailovii]